MNTDRKRRSNKDIKILSKWQPLTYSINYEHCKWLPRMQLAWQNRAVIETKTGCLQLTIVIINISVQRPDSRMLHGSVHGRCRPRVLKCDAPRKSLLVNIISSRQLDVSTYLSGFPNKLAITDKSFKCLIF